MDNDRGDEPEQVRLPGSGRPAEDLRPDYAWQQQDYRPPPRYRQGADPRRIGIGSARRASTWTLAALIAGVAATTGYLAHAIPAGGSGGTGTSAGHARSATVTPAGPAGPAVSGPVVTSGGSGVTGGGGDN